MACGSAQGEDLDENTETCVAAELEWFLTVNHVGKKAMMKCDVSEGDEMTEADKTCIMTEIDAHFNWNAVSVANAMVHFED